VPTNRPLPASARAAAFTRPEGNAISHTPNKLIANATNSAVTPMFSHGLAANRLRPDAPNANARMKPTAVNVSTMPSP
jgi:hypothetical protein